MEKSNSTKIAFINGAAGGMGFEIAKKLFSLNYSLALAARNLEKLEELKSELIDQVKSTGEIQCYYIDTSVPKTITNSIDRLISGFKKIDVFVDAIGIVRIGGFLDVEEHAWNDVINTNLIGRVRIIKAILPLLVKQGHGSIVLINGLLADQPDPSLTINSAITGAVKNLSKSLSKEFAKYGVRVNLINPGPTETELWNNICQELSGESEVSANDIHNQVVSKIPLNRIATARDVANLVEFLASDNSEYITGASFPVDGGLSA